MGRGSSKASNTGFRFQEGNKQEIRNAAIEDLTQKEQKRWKDSKLAEYFINDDVRAVDKALDYLEENNIKNIIDKSDDYDDSIKWKFSGKDKSTGKFASFEFDSMPKESNAMENLKGNGYSVTDKIVLPVKLHNYLVQHTNMTENDIKAVRSIAKVALNNYKKKR